MGRGHGKSQADRVAALKAVYDSLPAMTCEGLCSDSCWSMWQTPTEQRRVEHATGIRLPLVHAGEPCPALTLLRQCAVYEVRPMVCRIWGMTLSMRCQYGCTPKGGHLSDARAYELIAQVFDIDGNHVEAERMRAPWRDDPEATQAALLRAQRQDAVEYQQRTQRPDAVFYLGPGRLTNKKPGGSRF